MRTSTLLVFLLFFTVEFMVLPHSQVLAGPAEDVQSAMQLLKSKSEGFKGRVATYIERIQFRREAAWTSSARTARVSI